MSGFRGLQGFRGLGCWVLEETGGLGCQGFRGLGCQGIEG